MGRSERLIAQKWNGTYIIMALMNQNVGVLRKLKPFLLPIGMMLYVFACRDFRLFRQDFNKAWLHMQNVFRNAATITNAFLDPITDNPYAQEIVERINARVNSENLLSEYVIT